MLRGEHTDTFTCLRPHHTNRTEGNLQGGYDLALLHLGTLNRASGIPQLSVGYIWLAQRMRETLSITKTSYFLLGSQRISRRYRKSLENHFLRKSSWVAQSPNPYHILECWDWATRSRDYRYPLVTNSPENNIWCICRRELVQMLRICMVKYAEDCPRRNLTGRWKKCF